MATCFGGGLGSGYDLFYATSFDKSGGKHSILDKPGARGKKKRAKKEKRGPKRRKIEITSRARHHSRSPSFSDERESDLFESEYDDSGDVSNYSLSPSSSQSQSSSGEEQPRRRRKLTAKSRKEDEEQRQQQRAQKRKEKTTSKSNATENKQKKKRKRSEDEADEQSTKGGKRAKLKYNDIFEDA